MSLYIQKGFLIFRELEIANKNFLMQMETGAGSKKGHGKLC